jgi:hypothetical protein
MKPAGKACERKVMGEGDLRTRVEAVNAVGGLAHRGSRGFSLFSLYLGGFSVAS